jgi:glycyl-tRNA synthetase beta chain
VVEGGRPVKRDLLLEIGTEEIPAGTVRPAAERLAEEIRSRLVEERLSPGEVRTAATPRRLTVHVADVDEAQPDREVTFTGPKESVGLDADGKPTKAGEGFLRSRGAKVEDLKIIETPKGRVCSVTRLERGREALDLLAEILPDAVRKLRFPKSMRWPGSPIAFSRPVRNVAALFGSEVVDFEVAGVRSGRSVPGHPFLARGAIDLADASLDAYVERLESEGKVVVRDEVRREAIRERVEALSREHGGDGRVDADLLEEVTFLVELPGLAVGSFDEEFLDVPREVLATAMKAHQRYFPVTGEDGTLRARFVMAHNRGDAPADEIRDGNERVLRARLADARFFWDQDRKVSLEARRPELANMLFHRKLGTLLEKTDRLAALAEALGGLAGDGAAAEAAARAALLCKSDLVTDMVGEFPELQGVMGAHYARADGEAPEVAEAIEAQYFPRVKGEPVPAGRAAALLTLAEKLDNLCGFFAIGKEPKGSGDPFGLRRQAVGIMRLLREGPIEISLEAAVSAAAGMTPAAAEDLADRVLAFVRDRVREALLDESRRYDLVDAALASGFDDLRDLDRRIEVLEALSADEATWPDLVTVVERTHNIARNVEDDPGSPRTDLLTEDAERRLFEALETHGAAVTEAVTAGDYATAAAGYREAFAAPVHAFFEDVYVNVDDEAVRRNRLALCRAVNRLITESFADLSLVVMASGRE